MECMVIARVRLNRQTAEAYALAFKKVFTRCFSSYPRFKPGSTPLGVLTDWDDAEINGLKSAVGNRSLVERVQGSLEQVLPSSCRQTY